MALSMNSIEIGLSKVGLARTTENLWDSNPLAETPADPQRAPAPSEEQAKGKQEEKPTPAAVPEGHSDK